MCADFARTRAKSCHVKCKFCIYGCTLQCIFCTSSANFALSHIFINAIVKNTLLNYHLLWFSVKSHPVMLFCKENSCTFVLNAIELL